MCGGVEHDVCGGVRCVGACGVWGMRCVECGVVLCTRL